MFRDNWLCLDNSRYEDTGKVRRKFEQYNAFTNGVVGSWKEWENFGKKDHGVFVSHRMFKRFGRIVGENAAGKVFVILDEREAPVAFDASDVISM